MSEAAVIDAPVVAAGAEPPAATTPPAQFTPPPHQVSGLLGISPSAAPVSAPSVAVPAVEPPAASSAPSDPNLPTPYVFSLIEKNPELKAHEKTLARFDDIEADKYVPKLAKSYAELAKFKGVLVPGVDAAPEDLANYRRINGLPADAKDYKMTEATDKRFDALGVKDPALKALYADAAHRANLTPAQVDAFSEAHEKAISQLVAANTSQSEGALQANVDSLKKEWGESFDGKLGEAQKLHEVAYAGAKLTESEQTDMERFSKTTAYTKLIASLSQRIRGESSLHTGMAGIMQSGQAKLEAFRKEIMGNNKHPFNDHTHPDHHKALAEFDQLSRDGKGWA